MVTFKNMHLSETEEEVFNARAVEEITSEHSVIFCSNTFFEYKDGCYRKLEDVTVDRWIQEIYGNKFSRRIANEIKYCLKTKRHTALSEVYHKDTLNLKNCLLDLGEEFISYPHSSEHYSINQLNVNFDEQSKCLKWIKTLNEIFESNQDSINTLQEFFGLCLTQETKFEKALICIGEGANGKSVVLHILQSLIGKENYSSIPVEKFNDGHYISSLFGKLANITTETSSKTPFHDATFKAIVSGDSIQANPKFKDTFTFNPICKLVMALNAMPRVDDKTSAFYRRLLILKFNRIFKDEEQNKQLRYELVDEELDGIFMWALEGLLRLRERKYFDTSIEMHKEIEEYKKTNNPVIAFIEEECRLDVSRTISKGELYKDYSNWCDVNGHRKASQISFGKELRRQLPHISEGRKSDERVWFGISASRHSPPVRRAICASNRLV